jgi:hypoxanthine phosphoribosyltransferase
LAGINYEVPTWSQIYDMLLSQAQKIQAQNYKAHIVVGVSRGGLIPARILTDLLETQKLATIQISFYQDIAQPTLEPTLKQTLTVPIEGKKVLLVDDIADTGGSLKLAQTHLHQRGALETKTATL